MACLLPNAVPILSRILASTKNPEEYPVHTHQPYIMSMPAADVHDGSKGNRDSRFSSIPVEIVLDLTWI